MDTAALDGQGLGCLQLDPGLVHCKGEECVLHVFDQNSAEYTYPYTVGGLMELVDDYLGREFNFGIGSGSVYATALKKALQSLLAYYGEGGPARDGRLREGRKGPGARFGKGMADGQRKGRPTGRLHARTEPGGQGGFPSGCRAWRGHGRSASRFTTGKGRWYSARSSGGWPT
ncbi:MAG: hypothetical protein IPN76_30910 [Saprospiraceae bacterium]|nr:hypothetical protein [Saprospiraceae bacterium]